MKLDDDENNFIMKIHDPYLGKFPMPIHYCTDKRFQELPVQVAFNLACLLTGKRIAFQVDFEDIYEEDHSNLCSVIQKIVKEIAPSLSPLEEFKFSTLGYKRYRWSVFWCKSALKTSPYQKAAQSLKLIEFEPLPIMTFESNIGLNDAERKVHRHEKKRMKEYYADIYKLCGIMLDIRCSYKDFIGKKASLRVLFEVSSNLRSGMEPFKAQMCSDSKLLSKMYDELVQYTEVSKKMNLFIKMTVLPMQNLEGDDIPLFAEPEDFARPI